MKSIFDSETYYIVDEEPSLTLGEVVALIIISVAVIAMLVPSETLINAFVK